MTRADLDMIAVEHIRMVLDDPNGADISKKEFACYFANAERIIRKIHENVKHTAENSKETASPSAEYHEEELTFTEALALVICTEECLRGVKEGKEKAVEAILKNLDHPESDEFKVAAIAYKNAAALEKMFSESYILCRKSRNEV